MTTPLAQYLPGMPVPRGVSTRILLTRYQNTQHAIAVRVAAVAGCRARGIAW